MISKIFVSGLKRVMRINRIGVILLAAGESARLGAPKQLLQFRDETLVRGSVKTALAVSVKVVVTLGERIEILREEITDLPVQVAENEDWKSGMSGSIKVGLKKLTETNEELDGALVMVCDQPLVDRILLEKIIKTFTKTDVLIVACEYQNTVGVPALFHRKLFPEIFALDSPNGAKQLIEKYRARTAVIAFPEGAIDVDTPDDYENLTRNFT